MLCGARSGGGGGGGEGEDDFLVAQFLRVILELDISLLGRRRRRRRRTGAKAAATTNLGNWHRRRLGQQSTSLVTLSQD